MDLPNEKYSIIYADPPWVFKNYSNDWHKQHKESRWVEKHYPCMTFDELEVLPVPTICEKNCACFLWVTYPKLKDGLRLLEAWGFQYKTVAFTWIKKNKKSDSLFWGMGFYTRSNAEICLLGIKGSPLKRISKSVHSVVLSNINQHSQKPAEVRDRIVALFGDLPRIELFARQKTKGWDVWGNEIPDSPIPPAPKVAGILGAI